MNNSQSISIDAFLKEIGIGRRPLNDAFFDESHETCKVFQRTGITVEDDEDLCHKVMKEFPCNVVGCKARFRNLLDFEMHYNGAHRYVCQECKKIRHNARLLEIHIQETHDSFFHVLAEKQPMYQCYVSECDSKFANANERRDHCTAVHKFPKNFRYDAERRRTDKPESKDAMDVEEPKETKAKPKKVTANLDKNQRTKTFMRHPSRQKNISQNTETIRTEEAESFVFPCQTLSNRENYEASLGPAMSVKSALAFVPRQVSRSSYSSALTKNKNARKNVLETETMMDLAESLPE